MLFFATPLLPRTAVGESIPLGTPPSSKAKAHTGSGGESGNGSDYEEAKKRGDAAADAVSSGRNPHLAAVIRNAAVGIAELSPDGRFLLVNDELCRMLGRSHRFLLDGGISGVLAREERASFEARLRQASESTERNRLEHRFTGKGGRTVWIDCVLTGLESPHGEQTVLVTAINVSRSRQVEEDLTASQLGRAELAQQREAEAQARRASEVRLQFALDAARMGTWTWDPRRDVATLDRRACDILGGEAGMDLSFADAASRHLPRENEEQYRECVRRIMEPGAEGNADLFEVELPWLREDGRSVWIQMTGQSHFEGEGAARQVVLLTGTLLDITLRKRSEEALANTSRQKDRFLATLAHELRNPLAPLSYAAELLREGAQQELEWSRGVIDRQLKQLTRLIDDLLDLSRINRDQLDVRRERVAVEDVLRSAEEASRPTLREAEQELELRVPPTPVYVHGDLVRLTQVFTNLLKNAAKFSTEPGRIRVEVSRTDDKVRIAVLDNGIGIPADELPHVFDMFYQSDSSTARKHGGLGIGLYLVRRLVELHDGSVEAHSAGKGKGSEFVVWLSELVEQLPDSVPNSGDEVSAAGAAAVQRVLVVDDNRDSADALAKLLRTAGHEVFVEYDGAAAVTAAHGFRPDVVLLDLGMPKVDGYEVCRRIRSEHRTRRPKIVALTGWGRPEDRDSTRAAGFDYHLVKPVGLADLEAVLGR